MKIKLIKRNIMTCLSKDQIQAAATFVDTLSADPNAHNFLQPVDWKELQLDDYPLIVKNPCDLSTVKSRVLRGDYSSFDEFIGDLQLIWDNCKLYNIQGSPIYRICERMERSYNRELNKFKHQQGIT